MEVPQNIDNRVTDDPTIPLLGIHPKKFENIHSQRYIHPYAHRSIIQDGHGLKTTKVSFNRGSDKEGVVHTYNGILLSHKKR